MSWQGENTVILRVQLDEQATEKKLGEITLALEQTTKAQALRQKERRLNIVTDEEYRKRSVELALQLKSQRGEFAANQKNLEQFRQAATAATGSVDYLKAQSALLTTQYNSLSEAERKGTAAGHGAGPFYTQAAGLVESERSRAAVACGSQYGGLGLLLH